MITCNAPQVVGNSRLQNLCASLPCINAAGPFWNLAHTIMSQLWQTLLEYGRMCATAAVLLHMYRACAL